MNRRAFITLLGGAAVAWPIAARAQQREGVRRIGVLTGAGVGSDDADVKASFGAFARALEQLGWSHGRNVQIDYRIASGNPDNIRRHAAELAALAPDVILSSGAATVGPVLQATRTIPVVFVGVVDPVGAGYADSMAQPGGNATGFVMLEYSMTAKYLELLKEVAPSVTRVAVLRARPFRPEPASSAQYSLPRRRSGWRSPRSTCATRARSSALSRPSRKPRTAA
jgi:putative ABC transport system substrate-binding protein